MLILNNPDFLTHLLKQLNAARREILVSTYLFHWEGGEKCPVGQIIGALLKAKERDVQVEVFLEGSQRLRAVKARNCLEAAKIPVHFDTPATFLHEKVVVIDGAGIFIGSQNFTQVSLTTNVEKAVYFEDARLAEEMIKEIRGRKYQTTKDAGGDALRIPAAFVGKFKNGLPSAGGRGPAAKLLEHNAHRGFDLYIYLISLAQKSGSAEIPLDYAAMAEALNIKKPKRLAGKQTDYARYYDSAVLQESLKDLERNYGLVDYRPDEKIAKPAFWGGDGPTIDLPLAYFNFGWDMALGLAAKVALLINLLETSISKTSPWWFRSQKDISRFYGLYPDSFSGGCRELKSFNLLEIEGKMQARGEAYDKRPANHYRLLDFYSRDDFAKRIGDFKKERGTAAVRCAQKLAVELGEGWDLSVIQELCDLKEKHGMAALTAAYKQVAKLAVHNPRRSVITVAKILDRDYREAQTIPDGDTDNFL